MPYEISIDAPNGIAEIRFREPVPHAEHLAARRELLATCRTRGLRKVLVDARELKGMPAMGNLFDFGASWTQVAGDTPVIVAGVPPEDPAVRNAWQFGETVALNRGLRTRAFDDVEQARAWLRDA